MNGDGLQGVELRHLRALLAIADECSFARAAERLGYAQSAVSQQIAALERAVGARLVERPGGPRPVALTEAGVLLAGYAERAMADLRRARADLDALAAGDAGLVRVGTFQSAGARLLPAVLAAFRDRRPRVRIELVEEDNDADLVELLAAGALDLCFAVPVDDPRFEGEVLVQDHYFLLAPPDSPLVAAGSTTLADLHGREMITYRDGCAAVRQIEDAIARAGAEPVVVFRTEDNLTLQRLVGAGMGHAVVPALCVEHGDHAGPAVVLPITDDMPPRSIALLAARDRHRSPAVDAFLSTATDVLAPRPVLA